MATSRAERWRLAQKLTRTGVAALIGKAEWLEGELAAIKGDFNCLRTAHQAVLEKFNEERVAAVIVEEKYHQLATENVKNYDNWFSATGEVQALKAKIEELKVSLDRAKLVGNILADCAEKTSLDWEVEDVMKAFRERLK